MKLNLFICLHNTTIIHKHIYFDFFNIPIIWQIVQFERAIYWIYNNAQWCQQGITRILNLQDLI